MKHIILLFTTLLLCTIMNAQEQKEMSAEETQIIKKQLVNNIKDPFSVQMNSTCKCIDSIQVNSKSSYEIATLVSKCIDKGVSMLDMSRMFMNILTDTLDKHNFEMIVNADKNSNDYKKTYYELERALMDSCTALKEAMKVNDKAQEHSFSDNETAMLYYNTGNELGDQGKTKEALSYYYKAIQEDSMFVFCWDNIGVCERMLKNYDKAIVAYKKSLSIDPRGATALQNLPIVYEKLENYDLAKKAYKELIAIDKENPEGYYGLARVQTITDDWEDALDNMCKAYNMYVYMKSPYRSDAEQMISLIYAKMKRDNKENSFKKILKKNNINPTINE